MKDLGTFETARVIAKTKVSVTLAHPVYLHVSYITPFNEYFEYNPSYKPHHIHIAQIGCSKNHIVFGAIHEALQYSLFQSGVLAVHRFCWTPHRTIHSTAH